MVQRNKVDKLMLIIKTPHSKNTHGILKTSLLEITPKDVLNVSRQGSARAQSTAKHLGLTYFAAQVGITAEIVVLANLV